ncbi:reverse transcriptase domain-containing protein [Tanacetum coccineum]
MADNRTMANFTMQPIEGYEDAIVVPPINANNFELKQPLINLVQSNKFTGRQDPHNHLRFFNKVTSTFRHPEVPNTSIKLLLFPFSLDGEARDWLDKEPPRSILTWDDLVSKFINQFFPPSKTTYLRNKITNFFQEPNESFNEAWERFKGLLRQCPHHGFSELHQLDTFYNSLNSNDQDALDLQQCDPEGGHSHISRHILNNDPLPCTRPKDVTPPGIQKDLKVVEPKESSLEPKDEIPEVELKELPPHLEYAFLEENNKLPVIISKDLSQNEKTSLIKVLKNRKQAIAWKLSDIRVHSPEFAHT